MTWLDEKYINLLSPRLDRFRITQRNPYKANFRCPYCGDSKKSKTKARGWIYVNRFGKLLFRCFNGCPGRSVPNFIKDLDPQLFKEYSMEKFSKKPKQEENTHASLEKEFLDTPENSSNLLDELMDRVTSLPEDHFAVKYLLDRGLTREMLDRFYFIDDIEKCESLSEKYKNKIHGHESRVGLPFYDRKGRLGGVTFRALEDHPIKYLNIKVSEDSMPLFGIDRVDLSKKVYVVEGPIDSLFLPNGVAVGSSDLLMANAHLPTCDLTLIFDNQPRNRELHRYMRKAIERGFSVFIWPKNFESGDLNDLVESGECPLEELPELINSNTYKGLKLQHKFNEWRKCA